MRNFLIGEKLNFVTKEFGHTSISPCIVTEKHEDHYIAEDLYDRSVHYWIDKDTEFQFERI